MVWGMMSHRVLSELHIVPQKQTINRAYYRNEILKKTCLNAIARKAKKGSVIERSMLEACQNFCLCRMVPPHTQPMPRSSDVQRSSLGYGRKGSGQLTPPT
ncbi:hypothetical protein LOD99_2233 [Oopsacas minuta]|uniref:Uncharacterized protein n=1 Tax=Oopsacas minuta TaxID=111878 RepID=A0AAV7K2G1_9METZ|nr:hypothetical protein LOD99_2233 [Oopsacas minuta]